AASLDGSPAGTVLSGVSGRAWARAAPSVSAAMEAAAATNFLCVIVFMTFSPSSAVQADEPLLTFPPSRVAPPSPSRHGHAAEALDNDGGGRRARECTRMRTGGLWGRGSGDRGRRSVRSVRELGLRAGPGPLRGGHPRSPGRPRS